MRLLGSSIPIFFVSAAIIFSTSAQAAAENFVVVGSKANMAEEITDLAELRSVFMGEILFWNDNERIVAILPDFTHSSTAAFAQQVLGMDRQEYVDYWRRKLFAGKGHPPREAENDSAAIQILRTTPAGIAILSHEPTNAEGFSILRLDPRSNRVLSATP